MRLCGLSDKLISGGAGCDYSALRLSRRDRTGANSHAGVDRPEIIWFGDRPVWVEKNDTSSPFIWTLDPFGNKEEIPFLIRDAARFYVHDLLLQAVEH